MNQSNLLRGLAMIHDKEVVDGIIARLTQTTDPASRRRLLSALCRLHFQEAPWKGQSWGTRPDTRGPYYQPEAWSETERIAKLLHTELDSSEPETAVFLVNAMNRNRIQSNQALIRLLELAEQDPSLLGAAVAQLVSIEEIPDLALPMLRRVATDPKSAETLLVDAVQALSKTSAAESVVAMFAALQRLDEINPGGNLVRKAQTACLRSRVIENQIAAVVSESNRSASTGIWADSALLQIASRKNASPEAKEAASAAIESAWQNNARRVRLIQAAATTQNHFLDERVLRSLNDRDATVAEAAAMAAKKLKLSDQPVYRSPKLISLKAEVAIERATGTPGNIAHGQMLFTKANCIACHTVSKDEKQKGPYLGNIAQTYKRKELATAILQPSKTIAQGFKTNIILDLDGRMVTGYVTEESADRVVMRDSEGKEFAFSKSEIEARKESLVSAMPEGLIKDYSLYDLASLLDYLQSLPSEAGTTTTE